MSPPRTGALMLATAAAVVALRLAVVLTGSHLVSHAEELYRGAIAREILAGLHAPLWSYQADHFSGGSLAVGLLATPPIALLGPRLFALKLVPIAFAAATAALAVRLLARRYGMRAALAGAVLLTVPPPGLVQLESLAKGFHTEAPLFTVAALGALLTFVRDGRRRRWLFVTGLVGGLGVSFTPIAALGLAGIVVTWIVIDHGRVRWRDALLLTLGVALGAAPALAYAVAHGVAPGPPSLAEVFPASADSVAVRLLKFPARVAKLLALAVPLAAGFPDVGRVSGLVLSVLYGVGAWSATVILFARDTRRRVATVLPLAIPAAVFVALYAATPIAIPSGTSAWASRHLTPLLVLGLMVVAVALARIPRGMTILAGLALLGAIGQAALLASEPPGLAWHERADSYSHLGMLWTVRAGRTLAALDVVQPRLERLDAERRAAAYRGAIEALEPADHAMEPATLPRLLARLPVAQHPVVWESMGRWLAGATGAGEQEITARLAALPPRGRRLACETFELGRAHRVALEGRRALDPWLAASPPPPCDADDRRLGVGYLLATYRHRDGGCPVLAGAVARFDPAQRRAVFRGAGRGAAIVEMARTGEPAGGWVTGLGLGDTACLRPQPRWSLGSPDGVATLAAAIAVDDRDDFFRGVGWEIADAFSEDPLRVSHTIDRLPESARAAAGDGAAAATERLR